MKFYSRFTLLILMLGVFLSAAFAQTGKNKKPVKKTKPPVSKSNIKPIPKPPIDTAAANYKILVEGSQSKVETPFIFVARDAETYALIRAMVEGLPPSSEIDFSKSAVIAGFAGERSSGGWSVSIKQSADKIKVDVIAPPKGSMNTQVITYPFQVAAIPLGENQQLNVEAAPLWTNQIKSYQVTKGEFESSGGFAGRSKKFSAEGTIGILNSGAYSTYFFNLSGKGSEGGRKISDTASGVLKENVLEIARVDAGTFAESPHPPLKMTGSATDKKLTLTFESLPATVADGYMAKGKLEAVKK